MSESPEQEKKKDSLLAAAARAIGLAAGTLVSTVGVHHQEGANSAPAPIPTGGKLPGKHKSRLPRKLKKALKKAGRRGETIVTGPGA